MRVKERKRLKRYASAPVHQGTKIILPVGRWTLDVGPRFPSLDVLDSTRLRDYFHSFKTPRPVANPRIPQEV